MAANIDPAIEMHASQEVEPVPPAPVLPDAHAAEAATALDSVPEQEQLVGRAALHLVDDLEDGACPAPPIPLELNDQTHHMEPIGPDVIPKEAHSAPTDQRRHLSLQNNDELFRCAEAGDRAAREKLVERFMPLAIHYAGLYAGKYEPREDLNQVASLGLLKAIDRFDLSKGVAFSSFATPTILGEIRRHFRDRTWGIRVPRSLQELSGALHKIVDRLEQAGQDWTLSEVVKELDVSEEEVIEAWFVRTSGARHLTSLDKTLYDEDDSETSLLHALKDQRAEDEYDTMLRKADVESAIAKLPERTQKIVRAKMEDLTQYEIADKIGVSQMQVSRILRAAVATMAEDLDR